MKKIPLFILMSSCVHSGLAQANFILNGAKEPSEEILQSWGIPELPDKNLMIINNREKMMSKDDNNKRQTEETWQQESGHLTPDDADLNTIQ